MSAWVAEGVHEKAPGIHVVDPHTRAVPAAFVDNALYGASRNEKLLEQARIELGEAVRPGYGGDVAGIHRCIGGIGAVAAHYRFHQLADEVVGIGMLSGALYQLRLGECAVAAVGHGVAPLVAVGEPLAPCAPAP